MMPPCAKNTSRLPGVSAISKDACGAISRGKGSGDDESGALEGGIANAIGAGESVVGGRCAGRLCGGFFAGGCGQEIPAGGQGMAVAICISGSHAFKRPDEWPGAAAPST